VEGDEFDRSRAGRNPPEGGNQSVEVLGGGDLPVARDLDFMDVPPLMMVSDFARSFRVRNSSRRADGEANKLLAAIRSKSVRRVSCRGGRFPIVFVFEQTKAPPGEGRGLSPLSGDGRCRPPVQSRQPAGSAYL
jgi:hypothetical protein